jgi:hypothetical protein
MRLQGAVDELRHVIIAAEGAGGQTQTQPDIAAR